MKINTVWAAYFSATDTTKTVVTQIAKELARHTGRPLETFDFTLPQTRKTPKAFGPGDLVVFGTPVYAGMIVGETPKAEDISVNVCKKKQLTNTRASGSDDALRLTPPRQMSLEQCLEFLADDELLECTPENLRLRKRVLDHGERMKLASKKKG